MAIPDKTRPRIGIFTRPIDKGTSGSGHHLLEIIRMMLKINAKTDHFDIRLIHYRKTERDIYSLAPEIIIPRNPFPAACALRPWNFDILHHSPLTVFSPLWGLGAKRTATIHSAEPNIIPQYYSLAEKVHAFCIKPVYARKMDHIFTVSKTSKEYFVSQWGVNPDKVSVCYNAVSPEYRSINYPPSTISRYATEGRYIFHISKYSPRKNPECILNAFRLLTEKEWARDLSLVLAGSGWENETTKEYIRKNGLEGKIVFTGFTPERDVVELFNKAEVFVFPSRAEGYGMPNVEAMACGCPVITSSAFAIPEIVGDAALLLDDPDDYSGLARLVEQVIQDRDLRETLIQKGYARAGSFSWEKSAQTVLDVYETLLQNPG